MVSMKNLLKVLGIIAIAAVIGFMVVGCGGGNTLDGDTNGDNTTPSTTPPVTTPPTENLPQC